MLNSGNNNNSGVSAPAPIPVQATPSSSSSSTPTFKQQQQLLQQQKLAEESIRLPFMIQGPMYEIEKMFKEHSSGNNNASAASAANQSSSAPSSPSLGPQPLPNNSSSSVPVVYEQQLGNFLNQVAQYLVQEKILPKENNFLTMENIIPIVKSNAGKIKYVYSVYY